MSFSFLAASKAIELPNRIGVESTTAMKSIMVLARSLGQLRFNYLPPREQLLFAPHCSKMCA
eukprot:scaffold45104_cov17-Prasinocladus_malaysianus.AAC.1